MPTLFVLSQDAILADVATFLGHVGNPVKPFKTTQATKVVKVAKYFLAGHLPQQDDHHFFEALSGFVRGRPFNGQSSKMVKAIIIFSGNLGYLGHLGSWLDGMKKGKGNSIPIMNHVASWVK